MDWTTKANEKADQSIEIMSYHDYMEYFDSNYRLESRTSFQYLLDMIDYYGKTEDGHYKVYQIEHPNCPPVYGQKKTQEAIYQNLKNFKEEGFNNKFLLLVGPNGSAKSSLVRKLMSGSELYSETKEGPLYTFSWVFPLDNFVRGTLGLNNTATQTNLASFAYLEDKDIAAIVSSELKDHPLLLIPREYRQEILEKHFGGNVDEMESLRKTYLYRGDLSKRNRMIYDALLKNYKGNHSHVLKHIRIERFHISRRYSSSAVTIEPQLHVDARMQQITMDRRLSSLPPSLQSLNLFSLQGEVILANRGMLEFSDLLKRPLDAFKYLLMTMETGTVNLQGVLTELDIFFIGTSNEIHLAAFKQHPDYNSFKGRFNFIRVPYLLNYLEEEKIYEEQVKAITHQTHFAPHSLKAICLFAIMTRIRMPLAKDYKDKKVANIAMNLSPLEKTLMFGKGVYPDKLDTESIQILKQNIEEVKREFENEVLYEGKFGLSPREIKHIIYSLAGDHKFVTFVEVLDYLEELAEKKNDYDFLNIAPQGDYHNPKKFIESIKEFSLDALDKELRESLGMIDNRTYSEYIERYIKNISALIKGEKLKNNITGKFEDVDKYFLVEFEKNANIKEEADNFRSQLISKLGAYSLDNPGKKISYIEVFPELVEKLQESFRDEQKKVILNLAKNLVYFEAERANHVDTSTPLSKENRELIQSVITNMSKQFNYTSDEALTLIKYLIKERY